MLFKRARAPVSSQSPRSREVRAHDLAPTQLEQDDVGIRTDRRSPPFLWQRPMIFGGVDPPGALGSLGILIAGDEERGGKIVAGSALRLMFSGIGGCAPESQVRIRLTAGASGNSNPRSLEATMRDDRLRSLGGEAFGDEPS